MPPSSSHYDLMRMRSQFPLCRCAKDLRFASSANEKEAVIENGRNGRGIDYVLDDMIKEFCGITNVAADDARKILLENNFSLQVCYQTSLQSVTRARTRFFRNAVKVYGWCQFTLRNNLWTNIPFNIRFTVTYSLHDLASQSDQIWIHWYLCIHLAGKLAWARSFTFL